MSKYICPRCKQNISSSQRLESHLNRKVPCPVVNTNELKITIKKDNLKITPEAPICRYCNQSFSNRQNLLKHIRLNRCLCTDKIIQPSEGSAFVDLQKEIHQLKEIIINKKDKNDVID